MAASHRIKEIIKEKGFTQEEFAEQLGISRNGLYQILNGIPSGQSLTKIAEALGVEMWELFADGKEIAAKYQENAAALADGIRCPACGAHIALNPQVKD